MQRKNHFLITLTIISSMSCAFADTTPLPAVVHLTGESQGASVSVSQGQTGISSNLATGSSTVSSVTTLPTERSLLAASTLPKPTASGSSAANAAQSALTPRVVKLEKQMQNFTNMNLPQQIGALQQEIQQQQGQLQVQAHDLKLLNEQQRSFYQDLEQRINQIQTLSGNSSQSALPNVQINNQTATIKSPIVTTTSQTIAKKKTAVDETTLYQDAFQFIINKQYDKAEAGLNNYLSAYPKGQYVANAHYWLGEIYLLEREQDKATAQFTLIVQHYANSSKLPDAQLKLAIIHAQSGKSALAKQEFATIEKHYPNTTTAQLAAIQLQQIGEKD